MAKVNKNGLRLDADFTEDTVGFAIESFLSVLSFPRLKFSIEPFSRGRERWLGADARMHGTLKGFRPFYMQFKRPSAYPDYSGSKIIKDRKSLGMTVTPRALYFGLREKRPEHWDYQHNVLLRLRRRLLAVGMGDATYVCPLFLDRSAYRFHVHASGLLRWAHFWRRTPWDVEEILIRDGSHNIAFNSVPVLNEHVSIPPHKEVSSARHSYSFTEDCSELCFHSPLALPEGASTLAEFLTKFATGSLGNEPTIQTENARQALRKLVAGADDEDSLPVPGQILDNQDGIGAWLAWGKFLKQEFQIEQFALMHWEN